MTVVYCSETGFTRRYALLLQERAGVPALSLQQAETALEPGSEVLFLGWLRAGLIQGLQKARKRYAVRAVCAVGMAERYDTEQLSGPNHIKDLPLFYLRGGYAPDRLRGLNRAMMAVAEKAMAKRAGQSEEGRAMLDAVQNGGDWVEESQLTPVLALLRG